ncbi:MAG: response regulator, partial [Myxococcales bacterium]|nr:response regulator [Myxococcales bacterium]
VLGCASLLQGTGLSHQQDDLVETLRGSGEHLLSLLEQILDVSRIESGELELVAQPFDLHALLLGIRDLFRPLAANRQLALEVRLDEGVPVQVVGDPLRVRQVLVNLVDNAVKFTDVGSITVRASCPDPADPGWVRVEVVDTGIGVGTDEVEALFDTFSQGEDSDARRYGGSGLGLAISSRLCRLMGGRLEVDSEPGRGSTFHFDVRLEPAEDTSPMAPAVAETEPVRLPSDLGILVVEDNLVNQKVVVGMLERLGCKAAVASGGAEALRAVEASPPDLVLMDLQMPGMDGLEATRRIRREFASVLHPWIIAVTAAAQAEDRRRSLDAGMNDYLAKPVRLVELRRALERGVEAMQQAGELAVHRG